MSKLGLNNYQVAATEENKHGISAQEQLQIEIARAEHRLVAMAEKSVIDRKFHFTSWPSLTYLAILTCFNRLSQCQFGNFIFGIF